MNNQDFAKLIDHTNLDPNATEQDIEQLCKDAMQCGFGNVCVRSTWVSFAKNMLKTSKVGVVSVVGFPIKKVATVEEMFDQQSQYTTASKVDETFQAIEQGATEIDMVIDLRALLEGDYHSVQKDIAAVVQAAHHIPVKVILETCFLQQQEISLACAMAEAAGASFVKTSTGFGSKGASIADITHMGKITASETGIKASGGVHTLDFAMQLFEASQKYKQHPFRIGASKLVSAFTKETTAIKSNY